jgi:hypothetical protein
MQRPAEIAAVAGSQKFPMKRFDLSVFTDGLDEKLFPKRNIVATLGL